MGLRSRPGAPTPRPTPTTRTAGEGLRASEADLVELLAPHTAPVDIARGILKRWSLQAHLGVGRGGGEDAWGDPALCQLPRRYILQAQGYMAITGAPPLGSPPAALRVGADRDRDLPDLPDPEIIGAVLEHAGFVVDYPARRSPPPGARWSRCGRRPPGWASDDGRLSPHRRARPCWSATGGLPGAEAGGGEQDFIQAIRRRGGDAKGSTGARASRCRYGSRQACVTVDARAAVASGWSSAWRAWSTGRLWRGAAAEAIADDEEGGRLPSLEPSPVMDQRHRGRDAGRDAGRRAMSETGTAVAKTPPSR